MRFVEEDNSQVRLYHECILRLRQRSVLIRGLKKALITANMGNIKIGDALKCKITDRIFTVTTLSASGRILFTEDCESVQEAISMAVWDAKTTRSGAFGRWHEVI